MKFNKGIIAVIVGVIVIVAGLTGLSLFSMQRAKKEFISDGYILNASNEDNVEAITDKCEQIYFSSGESYKEKFGKNIVFKNTSNEKVELDPTQFIHYTDESMGSFTKGVIMDLDALDQDQYSYYSISKNTILLKNGQAYEMTSKGEKITMPEFIWKISDNDYTICSPEITISLGNDYEVVLEGYAQLKYVDNGIVRIVHQQGTYQTVSEEAYLKTSDGAVLNLAGKNFYVEDMPVLSLDSIQIGNESYTKIDENVDAPTIPTFNVINGADGQNGVDGESGADGEVGATGEDGFQGAPGSAGAPGTAGAAGTNGENGSNGKAGTDGQDGVEGNTGTIGYDGVDGLNGASGKKDEVTKEPLNLNAQPEVLMNSEAYNVTPGSANMELKLTDVDNALESGSTKVKLYNKQTMEEIEIDPDLGQRLENGMAIDFNIAGLSPDTEYLLQVTGKYAVKDGDSREVVFYSKEFKTEGIGLTLSKVEVLEDQFTLNVTKTNSDIEGYVLRVYKEHDETGNPVFVPNLDYQALPDASADYLYMEEKPNNGVVIESNTQYFACIQGVIIKGAQTPVKLDYSQTEIAFKTLKKKPYKADEGGIKTDIELVKPSLTVNQRDNALVLDCPPLEDPDLGIKGYKYELFRTLGEGASAIIDAEPAYVVESDTLASQSFTLPDGDTTRYVGKVVVIFDDNEKTVEYETMFSDPQNVNDKNTFPIIKFSFEKIKHDQIGGTLIISDEAKICGPYIGTNNPLILNVISEYNDNISIVLDTPIQAGADGTYIFNFNPQKLRTDTLYTFSVSGPVDTDGNKAIDTTERITYLGGQATRTANNSHQQLAIVGTDIPSATDAFKAGISITKPVGSTVSDEDVEYQASVLEYIEFELVHIPQGENQAPVVIGTACAVPDTNAGWHTSDFDPVKDTAENPISYWINKDFVEVNKDTGLGELRYKSGYTAASTFELTPKSFGLGATDSVFDTGGTFIIRVKNAIDYTKSTDTAPSHDNKVYFKDGQNLYSFRPQEKHVRSTNPNDQVYLNPIFNKTADKDMAKNNSLDDDTVVGLSIRAKYGYSDATTITYYVYEIDKDYYKDFALGSVNDQVAVDGFIDELNENQLTALMAPDGTNSYIAQDPSSIYANGENLGAYIYDENYPADLRKVATLVAKTSITALNGDNKNSEVQEVKLYFGDANRDSAESADDKLKMKFAFGAANPQGEQAGGYWESVNGGKVERGKYYFVCYSVITGDPANQNIDCDDNGARDIYPFCTYDVSTPVPFYRSAITKVARQTPKVERYLVKNTTGITQQWAYRVVDPDNGLTDNGNISNPKITLYKSAKANDLTAAMSSSVSYDFNPALFKTQSFENIFTFSGLTENYYYISSNSYYQMDSGALLHIESDKVKAVKPGVTGGFKSSVAAADLLKGAGKDNIVIEGNIVSGTPETAITDEGGYRYRIMLRSGKKETLQSVPAIRVTITEVAADGSAVANPKKIVYDPVYINVQGGTRDDTGLEYYAYAYLDTTAMEDLISNGVVKAKVDVEAYYRTGNLGMTNVVPYASKLTDDSLKAEESLANENVYAIKQTNSSGQSTYVNLGPNGDLQNVSTETDPISSSVFAPASAGNQPGFYGTGRRFYDGREIYYFAARYFDNPLSLVENDEYYRTYKLGDDIYNLTGIKFDQTGIRIPNGSHIEVEQLGVKGISFIGDNVINISDILPAVDEIDEEKSMGARSIKSIYELVGAGASETNKIYVKVYEKDGDVFKQLKLTRDFQDVEGEKVTIYTATSLDDPGRYVDDTYNKYENYADLDPALDPAGDHINSVQIIPEINGSDTKYTMPISFRGLKGKTDYQVVFYAYDSAKHEVKNLYSIDGQSDKKAYEYHTKDDVISYITAKENVYKYYNNKEITFKFNVEGDDGTGIIVEYGLFKFNGETGEYVPVETDNDGYTSELEPLGAGTKLAYYSQNPNINHKMEISNNPKDNLFGGKYVVRARLVDTTNGDLVGTCESDPFTVGELTKPSFNVVTSTQAQDETHAKLNITTVVNDAQHAIVDDPDTKIGVYVFKSNETIDGKTPIATFGVEANKTSVTNSVVFDDMEYGVYYKVVVAAYVDLQNKGKDSIEAVYPANAPYLTEINVIANSGPSASFGAPATTNKVTLMLGALSNFENVKNIAYSIYTTDGKEVKSGKFEPVITPENTIVQEVTGLSLKSGTQLSVMVQYLGENGEVLGNNSTYTAVGGAAQLALTRLSLGFAGTDKEAEAGESIILTDEIKSEVDANNGLMGSAAVVDEEVYVTDKNSYLKSQINESAGVGDIGTPVDESLAGVARPVYLPEDSVEEQEETNTEETETQTQTEETNEE